MGISTDNKYDAIVVGSGLGGLSCALHMAKEGLKVLVLEKQPKIGGYCQNYMRGDYIFDVSLHILPALHEGEGLYRLLDDLGVLDSLEIIEHKPMFRSIFPDRTYNLPGGREDVIAYLKEEFPDESDGISRYFNTIEKMVESNTALFWSGEVDFENFFPARYYGKTYRELLDEFLSDDRLKAILGQLWQSTGLPDTSCSANWAVEVNGWHLLSGNFYIRGGGQRLSNAMVHRLNVLGGAVLDSTLVNRILIENRQAVGVECADGQIFHATTVVSNANPFQTYLGMIGKKQLSAAYLEKLNSLEHSCSLLTMYIGLDCSAENIGITGHTLFINHSDDNKHAYELGMAEAYAQTDYMISNYTDDKGGNHPVGRGMIQVAEIAPGSPWIDIPREDYEAKKLDVQEKILAKVSRKFPDLRDHIVVCELATPRTMMQITRNPHGSVYGFSQIPAQADNSRFGSLTSFRGLYFTGAWCRGGGGGYMGSIINGRVTSRQILKGRK